MARPPRESVVASKFAAIAQDFTRQMLEALGELSISDLAQLSRGESHVARRTEPKRGPRVARKAINFPKCQWPGCGKNMSPRTRPWCGEHNRRVQAGEKPPLSSAAEATGAPESESLAEEVTGAAGTAPPKGVTVRKRKRRSR